MFDKNKLIRDSSSNIKLYSKKFRAYKTLSTIYFFVVIVNDVFLPYRGTWKTMVLRPLSMFP